MSATASLATATVSTLVTDDGMLVRLGGALNAESTPELRDSLLRARPAGCDDVIIDAGDVTAVDDDALAVLLAAGAWAVDTGARLSFSRMAEPLRLEVDLLGFAPLLPVLEPAGERAGRPAARLATAH